MGVELECQRNVGVSEDLGKGSQIHSGLNCTGSEGVAQGVHAKLFNPLLTQDPVQGSGHVPPLKRCANFGSEYQVEVLPPVARLLFEFLLVLPLDVEYFLQLRCEGNGPASCFCFRGTDLQRGSAGIVLVKVAVSANGLNDGEEFAVNVAPAEAREFCKADASSKHEVQSTPRRVIRKSVDESPLLVKSEEVDLLLRLLRQDDLHNRVAKDDAVCDCLFASHLHDGIGFAHRRRGLVLLHKSVDDQLHMIKGYKIDVLNNKVYLTASFLRAASHLGTPEYNELLALRRELPDYEFQKADTNRKKTTNKNKNLT